MLEVRDLHAGYGGTQVLHGVSLDVGDHEIVALLGSNGAGKSTLNNNISRLYQPFSGSIHFEGVDITRASSQAVVELGLVQVPEGRRVFPTLSVRDNLVLGSYRRGRPNRARNLAKVLDIFPRLRERFSQLAGTLSGGEQQMLAIGRALMAEPRLLVLDEPSLGLSPLLVDEMFALIHSLHEDGLSVFLIEQNVVQSLQIAKRAYVIENGVVTLSGPAHVMLDDPELKKSYLGM